MWIARLILGSFVGGVVATEIAFSLVFFFHGGYLDGEGDAAWKVRVLEKRPVSYGLVGLGVGVVGAIFWGRPVRAILQVVVMAMAGGYLALLLSCGCLRATVKVRDGHGFWRYYYSPESVLLGIGAGTWYGVAAWRTSTKKGSKGGHE